MLLELLSTTHRYLYVSSIFLESYLGGRGNKVLSTVIVGDFLQQSKIPSECQNHLRGNFD